MDLTMCSSENCPMKDTCYRVQGTPSTYQSWSNFEYSCNENSGFCDYIESEK